jgi:hypothetical protein
MAHVAGLQSAQATLGLATTQAAGSNAGTAAAVKSAATMLTSGVTDSKVTLSVKAQGLAQANPAGNSMPVHSMTSPSGPKPANHGAGMYQSVAKLA